MPEMDGFALVERIKSTPNLTNAFILMLTSGEHLGDLARCQELGISAFLTKPVRRAELRAAIVHAISDQGSGMVHGQAEGANAQVIRDRNVKAAAGFGAHNLLAEDN